MIIIMDNMLGRESGGWLWDRGGGEDREGGGWTVWKKTRELQV